MVSTTEEKSGFTEMETDKEECIEMDRTEPHILGIDEAGRGPVLGPMVYGTCYCPKSKNELLKALGFADSKTLTEAQRERLFELIKQTKELGWAVDIISPEDISDKMLRTHKQSLNEMSHLSAIGLIQQVVDKGVNVTEAFIDTVGTPEYYKSKLQRAFPNIEFTVTSKADSKFPIVSAASICAKVERDHSLDGWKYKELKKPDHSFGCGYPGDEKTKGWLQRHFDPVFGFPTLVRFSWQTSKTIMEARGQKVNWGDDTAPGQASLTRFFSGTGSTAPKLKDRFKFFQRRGMNLVTTM